MLKKIPTLLLAVSAILSTALADTSSPPNLICHTDNKSECYPKIFEATEDFQIVRDDQDLPPGLHVRLNIQTGLKEAKLYDGNDDDLSNTVEVHPDESLDNSEPTIPDSVQVIDAPPADYSPDAQIPVPPELYQHILHGGDRTIKKPINSDADADAFSSAISTLSTTSDPSTLLPALSTLEDLAHDIYWGLSLSQSHPAISSLSALIFSPSSEISSAAALVLGNTVHNNPKALAQTLTHTPDLPLRVRDLLFRPDPNPNPNPTPEQSCPPWNPSPRCLPPRHYTRLLFLLSSLLSPSSPSSSTSPTSDGLHELLTSGDFPLLLTHFSPKTVPDPAWDRPRQAIADFVLDRVAGPEAAAGLVELEWAVWKAREGRTGGDRGGWVSQGEGEAEKRGGEEAGWRRVSGLREDGWGEVWVRGVGEGERGEGVEREPRKFGEGVRGALVGSCEVFRRGLEGWRDGEGSAAYEHTLLAQEEVLARLREIGCEGCDCGGRKRDEL